MREIIKPVNLLGLSKHMFWIALFLSMTDISWITEKRNINDLIPAPYNPRHWTDDETKHLTQSLERFNLADPIIINQNNTVIGGHFRLKILKEKGINEIDVRIPSRQLTEQEEKELNIRLNKNLGEWDFDLLSSFDEDILKDIGFDSKELDKIFQIETKPEDDDVPETRQETDIKLGDIYQLGEHRLMCGDSTKKEDVEKLMAGEKADMVFTDPPYGAKITGFMQDVHAVNRLRHWDMIEGDQFENEELQAFLEKAFRNISEVGAKDNAAWYIWHAMLTQGFFAAAAAADLILNRQIIWVKPCLILAFGDYHWRHELCFYGWKKGFKPTFYGERNKTTVWDIDFDGKKRGNSKDRVHPTQKPVALSVEAIQNSSPREGIVIDLFGGSGSTLMGCEKTSRKCRMMEIDPIYCQVIIDRWEKFTNQKAVKLNCNQENN
jgi:DNA modification methylase